MIKQEIVGAPEETVLPARLDVSAFSGAPAYSHPVNDILLGLDQQVVVFVPARDRELELRLDLVEAAHARQLQQLLRLVLEFRTRPIDIDRPSEGARLAP